MQEVCSSLQNTNSDCRQSTLGLTEAYQGDIHGMANAMNEFAISCEQVQESIVAIKEAIDAINIAMEENAEGITNVTTATVEIATSMNDIQNDAQKNLDVAEELYTEVRRFKF